jgi:NADPH2:quinone reductase
MRLEEVPDPQPQAGQVVLRVHAIGVNPVETYIRSGMYAAKPALPYTPGSDAAGVVEAVGQAVTNLKPGDRVYTTGTLSGAYAEKALCRADQCHPLPETLSFEQGAAVNVPYTTAYRAIYQRAAARPGQTVLVHGATGGVGIACVQFCVAAGMTVIGTGGTEQGRRLVLEQGAAHVLDHRSDGYLDQLMQWTGGRGVDVILEMLANVNLGKDLTVLGSGGVVVVIGSRGPVQINPRDLMRSNGRIAGLLGGKSEEYAEAHAAVAAGLRAGFLRPVVGKSIPLAEAARAHQQIIEGTALGKLVLIP